MSYTIGSARKAKSTHSMKSEIVDGSWTVILETVPVNGIVCEKRHISQHRYRREREIRLPFIVRFGFILLAQYICCRIIDCGRMRRELLSCVWARRSGAPLS